MFKQDSGRAYDSTKSLKGHPAEEKYKNSHLISHDTPCTTGTKLSILILSIHHNLIFYYY